jgi:1,4-dihydroxy-2-naphthoate octaprenyltransferase
MPEQAPNNNELKDAFVVGLIVAGCSIVVGLLAFAVLQMSYWFPVIGLVAAAVVLISKKARKGN